MLHQHSGDTTSKRCEAALPLVSLAWSVHNDPVLLVKARAPMSESEPSWCIRIDECKQPRDAGTPEWANESQRSNWRRRGLIVWGSITQQIAHLFAINTLEIHQSMRNDSRSRRSGLVIGTPVSDIDLRDPDAKGVGTLAGRITLAPE